MPVLLWAEMSLGFHRLSALRTNRPPASGHFHAPARKGAQLRTRAPETHHRRRFGILFLGQQFFRDHGDDIADLVIDQPDLAHAELGVHGRMDVHLILIEIGRSLREVRVLARHVREELLDADRQRLQLRLLDQHRYGGLILPPRVDVKDALAGLADRVGGNMFAGVNFDFDSRRHEASIPEETEDGFNLLKILNPIILFGMRHNLHRTLTLLVLALTLAGCTLPVDPAPQPTPAATATPSPLGTPGNPIVLAIRPGSTKEAEESAQRIAEQLSSLTGLTVVAGQVESTKYLIESLGEGTAHIAMLSPFAYLLAHEKGYADAALAGVLNGKDKFGAQFLVNAQLAGVSGYKIYFDSDSNVNLVEADVALAQFEGARPCWSDAYSPAGYVLPLGVLNLQTVVVKPGAFLQGDAAVVKTIYQDVKGGLCEFGVTVTDSRAEVSADLPDVNQKVLVVWRTEELIPAAGIAYAASLTDEMRFQITAALLVIAAQRPGDIQTCFGVDNLVLRDDTHYNDLRAYLQLSGLNLADLVR